MILNAPRPVGALTSITYSEKKLQGLPCGLHRARLSDAMFLIPELSNLYKSCPVPRAEWDEWFIDVKIHMLMKGQFPCIPNWHTDNVPRVEGATRFDLIEDDAKPMYVWLSSGPTTEFIAQDFELTDGHIKAHGDFAGLEATIPTEQIKAQQWYQMSQTTPHRGTCAEDNHWRVFARLTHQSISSGRPVLNNIRRHAQVYLDASTFTW